MVPLSESTEMEVDSSMIRNALEVEIVMKQENDNNNNNNSNNSNKSQTETQGTQGGQGSQRQQEQTDDGGRKARPVLHIKQNSIMNGNNTIVLNINNETRVVNRIVVQPIRNDRVFNKQIVSNNIAGLKMNDITKSEYDRLKFKKDLTNNQ